MPNFQKSHSNERRDGPTRGSPPAPSPLGRKPAEPRRANTHIERTDGLDVSRAETGTCVGRAVARPAAGDDAPAGVRAPSSRAAELGSGLRSDTSGTSPRVIEEFRPSPLLRHREKTTDGARNRTPRPRPRSSRSAGRPVARRSRSSREPTPERRAERPSDARRFAKALCESDPARAGRDRVNKRHKRICVAENVARRSRRTYARRRTAPDRLR